MVRILTERCLRYSCVFVAVLIVVAVVLVARAVLAGGTRAAHLARQRSIERYLSGSDYSSNDVISLWLCVWIEMSEQE